MRIGVGDSEVLAVGIALGEDSEAEGDDEGVAVVLAGTGENDSDGCGLECPSA